MASEEKGCTSASEITKNDDDDDDEEEALAPWTLNAQRPARFTQHHSTHHNEAHAGQ